MPTLLQRRAPTRKKMPELSRFDNRKEKILNAASALFNRHGLRDATLAVIAAEIGLNFKSLRYYYKRREDLVSAAFMRSIEMHEEIIREALAETTIELRVQHLVRRYFELLTAVRSGERPEFVFFGDLRALAKPHSDLVWPAYSQMFKSIRKLLVSPEVTWSQAQLNAATHALLSQLLWTPVWTVDYFAQDIPLMTRSFADVLLYGLAKRRIDLSRFTGPEPASESESDRLSQTSFIQKAIELINEFGYRGASVDRISEKLNVTKGAFYHHNETLDELVVASFRHSFACLQEAQDAAFATQPDGLSCIAASAVSLVRKQMLDRGTLLRTAALTAIGPALRDQMAREMSQLTLRFGNMLNDGLIDGSVRPCNVRIAAEMITAMVNSSEELARWVSSANAENAGELAVGPLVLGLLAFASPAH